MPTHIFREVAAAHVRTATARAMDEEAFRTYFAPWEGKQGQINWLNKTAQFDEEQTAEFEALLTSMDTPTRVIWGGRDAWLDPSLSERIVERLPRADRVLIPEAGHFSMEDEPAEVTAALAENPSDPVIKGRLYLTSHQQGGRLRRNCCGYVFMLM